MDTMPARSGRRYAIRIGRSQNQITGFGPFQKITSTPQPEAHFPNPSYNGRQYFHENQTSESLDDVDAEPDIPVSETPEQLMINKESLTELHHRIDEMLTDFEKSVFALYVGSMSYMDIAKALSKPKKSIDNAIHRIKAKLRKLL